MAWCGKTLTKCLYVASRNSIILVVQTGYVFAWLMAMLLENILPEEEDPTVVIKAHKRKLERKEAELLVKSRRYQRRQRCKG